MLVVRDFSFAVSLSSICRDISAATFYIFAGQSASYTRRDGLPFAKAYFLSFISPGSLARDDLVQPGEIIVGFSGDAIKFCPYQTVLPGLT